MGVLFEQDQPGLMLNYLCSDRKSDEKRTHSEPTLAGRCLSKSDQVRFYIA